MFCEPDVAGTSLRTARVEDATAIWRLVRSSGVLDLNSPYAYLLVCLHHHRTCLVAEEAGSAGEGGLAGFVVAYCPPGRPDVVFVWQIGVVASQRGRGLGRRLLDGLLANCPEARFLECTVSPSNAASLGLFRGLAARRGAAVEVAPGFAPSDFPAEEPAHERENLVRVGPLTPSELPAPPTVPSAQQRSSAP